MMRRSHEADCSLASEERQAPVPSLESAQMDLLLCQRQEQSIAGCGPKIGGKRKACDLWSFGEYKLQLRSQDPANRLCYDCGDEVQQLQLETSPVARPMSGSLFYSVASAHSPTTVLFFPSL